MPRLELLTSMLQAVEVDIRLIHPSMPLRNEMTMPKRLIFQDQPGEE
jgi:hypothetical protein